MNRERELRAARALVAVECIPPTLRESLARDTSLLEEYDLQADTIFRIGESDFAAQLSELVPALRQTLAGTDGVTVRDTDGSQWSIECSPEDRHPTLTLALEDRHEAMDAWLTLSPNSGTRLRCLEVLADDVGLPPAARLSWNRVLLERSLKGQEVLDFLNDIHCTPHVQEQLLAQGIRMTGLHSKLAAPGAGAYFERLVGVCGDSTSIARHAATGGRQRLAELSAWKPYEGFLHSLYMASHPDLSAQIQVTNMSSEDLRQAYAFVLRSGDTVSQLGAIEVGLRVSLDRPEVNPVLTKLVELIRDDDAKGKTSGLGAYSVLYLLVHGELSSRQLLAEDPPFYRRLAALAQAGVIQRQMVAAGISLKESALESTAGEYLVRSLVDLRVEPRRQPELALPEQLRAHFLRRIAQAAGRYGNEVDEKLLDDVRRSACPGGILPLGDSFVPLLPGPLEEAEEMRELPAGATEALRSQLQQEEALTSVHFTGLANCARNFRIGGAEAKLATSALTQAEYRLTDIENPSHLGRLLASLASVAAIARDEELADALRVVVRRYGHQPAPALSILDTMRILLGAAASREELGPWANFVGDCVTELAFGDLREGDGQILLSYVQRLCGIVPELWTTCARAEAALTAYNASKRGSAPRDHGETHS